MSELDHYLRQARTGKISRREFVGRAGSLGLGVAAASTLLTSKGFAQTPGRGGTITIGTTYTGPEETFDPTKMGNTTDAQRSYQVYNRLCNLDRDMKLVPNLATEWSSKPGAAEWTFVLRDGVEFHNGKTLTPEDVIYSIGEHIKEGSRSPAKPILQAITAMRADGNTVVLELSAGNADLPYVFAHDFHTGIVPAGWKDGDPVAGTGPYKLIEFTPGGPSVTQRFENYWKSDAAWVDTFITQGISDETARIAALQSGGLDVVMSLDPKLASMVASDPNLSVAEIASGSHFTFAMLCDTGPTADLNVRLALKYAFHRQAMVDAVLRKHGQIGNDLPVSPALPTYARNIPQRDFDADKAAFYWKKGGLSSIELVVSNAVGNGEEAGLVLQQHALEAGIQVDVKRVPSDGYLQDTWMKVPFCVSGWNARPTADLILSLGYRSTAPWNETHFKNERFDSLLDEGRVELDETKRIEIYAEAQQLLYDEGGVIVPFFKNYIDATAQRVRNFTPSPAYELSAGWIYEDVWVEEA